MVAKYNTDAYEPVNFYDRSSLLLSKQSYFSAKAKFVNKKEGIIKLYIMNLEYLNLECHIKKYSKYDNVIKKFEKISPENEHKYIESIMDKSYDIRYLCPGDKKDENDEEIILKDAKNDIEFVQRLFKDLSKSKIDSIINAIIVDGFLNCFSQYLMFRRIEESNSTTHITLTEKEIYNDIIRYFAFDCYKNIDINELNENQKKIFDMYNSEFEKLD
ncbi:MAG: hypothetical protein ACRCZI_05770 [Cetobacterium sp.]